MPDGKGLTHRLPIVVAGRFSPSALFSEQPFVTHDHDPLGETYESEVIDAVITAVLDVRADEAKSAGVVHPERTFAAMCDAIAAMAFNMGAFTRPSDQQEFAEKCRLQILTMLKALQREENAGNPMPWEKAQRFDPPI